MLHECFKGTLDICLAQDFTIKNHAQVRKQLQSHSTTTGPFCLDQPPCHRLRGRSVADETASSLDITIFMYVHPMERTLAGCLFCLRRLQDLQAQSTDSIFVPSACGLKCATSLCHDRACLQSVCDHSALNLPDRVPSRFTYTKLSRVAAKAFT